MRKLTTEQESRMACQNTHRGAVFEYGWDAGYCSWCIPGKERDINFNLVRK
jgi:hypothetical protein